MNPRREAFPSFRRFCLMATLLAVFGGQAAFAFWTPVYVDDVYMGCELTVPLSPDSGAVVSPNSISSGECRFLQIFGLSTAGGDDPISADVLDSAKTFTKDFGLDSDANVRKIFVPSAAKLRRQAEDLQAAALELARGARKMEALDTAVGLEGWIADQLKPRVCSPSNR